METLLFAAVGTASHRHGAEQELQTLQTKQYNGQMIGFEI